MEWWRGKGLKPGRQRRHPVLPNQPPNIPDCLLATSHIPKQGCSGWDQHGEELKGCTPAGRGLEICSQGQCLRDQDGSQNFHPRPSTIPRRLKPSPRKKKDNSPLPFQGPWEGGWAEIRNLKRRPWAGLRVQQALGPLGPHRRGRHLQSS